MPTIPRGPQAPAARVVQVSPTLKADTGRPSNIHEMLQQLNLLKYEPIFIEQDIDLEVSITVSTSFCSQCCDI